MEEGKLINTETERVANSQCLNNIPNERSLLKQIEEILFPENLEINNLISIIEADKLSFKIDDFLEAEAVKNLSIDKKALLAEMKYIRFIEFSKDDSKCFLNYDKNTQIFTFSKLPSNILGYKNDEIYEKLNLKNHNQNQYLEILRLKKCKKFNKMILVVSSYNAILKNQNFFSNLKFVQDNNILIESQDIESVYDKIRKADPNSTYNVETKNLKAERNGKIHNTDKITNSRHNSGSENLSWRKISTENNKEYSLKTNFYNGGYKKNSFANGKNNNSNYNNGNHNYNSHTKSNINSPNEIKRERFNSETVGDFSHTNNNNGKFNNQKNFHKNSFSTVNNIYFSKNLGRNTETTIPTLTNNPLSLINKNFSNEIEIDTSKIKYPLQKDLKSFKVKFKYTENDIDVTYEALKISGILDLKPEFKNYRSELITEKRKDLNKNFFSKDSNNNNNNPYREQVNTFQTHFNNAAVNSSSNGKNLEINDLSINNPEKNGNGNEANKENCDKKKISLNVNSPKFTRKSIANDIPTFNPLSNIAMPFNKFDKFDPSAN